MAWAVSITEKVNQISELDVGLWSPVFSPGLGTLVWTAGAQDLAELEATDAKLMVDDGYIEILEAGTKFSSGDPVDDALIQLILADEDPEGANAQYAFVVQSALAPGKSARGIELGVEIAQRARAITGATTAFGAAITGVYGGVAWITGYASVEKLQAAGDTLNADASFTELVDAEASQAYLVGATTQTIYRRIV
jgi:hypothetical protein